MVVPRQSSGAPSEASEAEASRAARAAESLRLPLMRDDETDLLGFDDDGVGAGSPRRPWQSRRVIGAVAASALAVGVSMVIGVIFGFYPALRAARLDPIVALRVE